MSGQTFISYRREERRWSATSLRDRLCRHLWSFRWGEGKTASSDGQRFRAGGRGIILAMFSRDQLKRAATQAIKANPSKPSVDAMLTLLDKLKVIEATGVLGVDLSWLNGNYQRALFHHVRKSPVIMPAKTPAPNDTTWGPTRLSCGPPRVAVSRLPIAFLQPEFCCRSFGAFDLRRALDA
jgi:hypothetical protein